jgi:hypothetical protein
MAAGSRIVYPMKRLNTLSRSGAGDLQHLVAQTFGQFSHTHFVAHTDICQEIRSIFNNVGNPPALRAQALATLLAATDRYPSLLTLKDEKGTPLSAATFGFREFCGEFPQLSREDIAVIFHKVGLIRDVPNVLKHTNNSLFLGI